MNPHYLENFDDNKRAKLASQAYDEGSVPFTRSNGFIASDSRSSRLGDRARMTRARFR
jgi:hypothetical protein